MSPKESVVLTKLEQIQNCILRIESKVPFTVEELKNDFDLQDVVSLNLQRAIQVSVDLGAYILSQSDEKAPQTMAETFRILASKKNISPELADLLVKSVGLRNALVHEYDGIKWDIVHEVATQHLDVFRQFVKAISKVKL